MLMHGLKDSVLLRYQFSLKLIYKFHAIPIKNPSRLFVEIIKLFLKFIWKCKRPFKKNNVGGLLLPNFNAFYKTIIIKAQWYQWKSRPINQWNRRKLRNRLTWSIDFWKGYQGNSMTKKNSFQQTGTGTTGYLWGKK